MKIFVSHKMPADTEAVSEFAERLALYGGKDIQTSHAGKFQKGANFRKDIEAEIISSDIFILFLTSQAPGVFHGDCVHRAGLRPT